MAFVLTFPRVGVALDLLALGLAFAAFAVIFALQRDLFGKRIAAMGRLLAGVGFVVLLRKIFDTLAIADPDSIVLWRFFEDIASLLTVSLLLAVAVVMHRFFKESALMPAARSRR